MNLVAIASYKPKAGKENEFLQLLEKHVPTLRDEGLVSNKASYSMRAKDGTIIEVFEWLSSEAKALAHQNARVNAVWGQFFELAELVNLGGLEESTKPFAAFENIGPMQPGVH